MFLYGDSGYALVVLVIKQILINWSILCAFVVISLDVLVKSIILTNLQPHVVQACDSRVLRGAHEWEQHKQGRGHRKRTQRLKQKCKVKSAASEVEV